MKGRKIFLEKIIEGVLENTYLLHETGGQHVFAKRCSPKKKIKKIYRKKIWPWIEAVTGTYKDRTPSITTRDPYPKVSLVMEGARKKYASQKAAMRPTKTVYIHSLVGMAFLYTEPLSKDRINHINGKTVDYRVCNLEWITASDNNRAKKPRGQNVWDKKYDIFKAKKFV